MKRRTFLRTTTGSARRERGPARPLSACSLLAEALRSAAGPSAAAHPAALVVAGGEHRRHRAHAGRAGAAREAHPRGRSEAVGVRRPLGTRSRRWSTSGFPSCKIVKGTIGADGRASNADLATPSRGAISCCTAPGRRSWRRRTWRRSCKHTGKPFGVYGITHGGVPAGPTDKELCSSQAKFVFFRDSVSLELGEGGGRAPAR